jgi:hypothetical protein
LCNQFEEVPIMRKVILVVALSALAIAPAFAEFGELIRSWLSPGHNACAGITWDGEYIWCNMAYSSPYPAMMYRCVPSNGSVVSWFETGFNYRLRGYDTCYRLWGGRPTLDVRVWDEYAEERSIYRFYFNGSIVDRTGVELPGGAGFTGICFDGSNNWVSTSLTAGSKVYKLSDRGVPITAFTLNGAGDICCLTKQGDFFWFGIYIEDSFRGFYKTRPDGSVVASFETPGRPGDCTFENKHLWAEISNWIICYDVSNAPAVAPASIGKVKALFR